MSWLRPTWAHAGVVAGLAVAWGVAGVGEPAPAPAPAAPVAAKAPADVSQTDPFGVRDWGASAQAPQHRSATVTSSSGTSDAAGDAAAVAQPPHVPNARGAGDATPPGTQALPPWPPREDPSLEHTPG